MSEWIKFEINPSVLLVLYFQLALHTISWMTRQPSCETRHEHGSLRMQWMILWFLLHCSATSSNVGLQVPSWNQESLLPPTFNIHVRHILGPNNIVGTLLTFLPSLSYQYHSLASIYTVSIHPSICLSIHPSTHPSVYPSIHPSINVRISYPSIVHQENQENPACSKTTHHPSLNPHQNQSRER